MAPILLKIKGNKSFSPFSNLDSEEELSKTWRVCTKVKDSLENGSRLENLSWRLWFLHHLLVDDSKSKSHFKKLSSNTTRQLEGEKGTALSQLPAPKKFAFGSGKDGGAAVIAQRRKQKEKEQVAPSASEKKRKAVTTAARSLVSEAMLGGSNLSTLSFSAPNSQPVVKKERNSNAPRKAAKFSTQQQSTQQISQQHTQQQQQQQSHSQQQQRYQPSQQKPLAQTLNSPSRQQFNYQQPQNPLYTNYDLQSYDLQQQQQQMRQVTENFVLHQYTSDQADNQVVELQDIFGPFDMHALLSSDPGQLPIVELPYDSMLTDPNGFSPLSSGAPSPSYRTSPMGNSNASAQNSYFYKNSNVVYPTMQQSTSQSNVQPGSNMHIPNSGRSVTMASAQSVPTSPVSHSVRPPQSGGYAPNPDGYKDIQQSTSLSSTANNSPSSQHTALYVPSTMPPPPGGTPQSNIMANSSAASSSDRYSLGMTGKPGNSGQVFSTQGLMYIDTASANTASELNSSNFAQQQARHNSLSAPTTPLSTVPPPLNNAQQSSGQFQPVIINQVRPPPQQPVSAPSSRAGSRASSPTLEGKSQQSKRSTSSRPTVASASASTDGEAGSKSVCSNCGATSTPLWRRSANDELLCNACGLYLKLHNAPRPKSLKPHVTRKDARGEDDIVQPVCSNCNTTTTPLWRRDDDGAPLCNACGLYLKLHHEKRPLSMKTDIIKKRQRYENGPPAPKGRPSRKARHEDESDGTRMSPPAGNSDDNEDASGAYEKSDMDYSFQYPQKNNNNKNQSSGSGSMMMTGY